MSKEKMAVMEPEDRDDEIVTGNEDLYPDVLIYTKKDARSFFEQGAAFAREHHFTPNHMNAIKAAEEALARWPD